MAPQKGKVNYQIQFIVLQIALYTVFMTLDLMGATGGLSSYVKYTMILLCFCYAVLFAGKGIVFFCENKKESLLLALLCVALFFTVISDLFLLILDYYLFGVLFFIIVQLLYAIRLKIISTKGKPYGKMVIQVVIQLLITGVTLLLLAILHIEVDFLLMVTVFYFICNVTNVLHAILLVLRTKGEKSNLLFAIGMVLFLLCDINVGLFQMGSFLPLPEHIYQPIYEAASILMWTFYAPSQVLITLSARRNEQGTNMVVK